MNQQLVRLVWERAANRCEYCRMPHPQFRLPFQIDHVMARKHAGETDAENLALACFHCNRFKGPNIAGRDPLTGDLVRLFDPRRDRWSDHFVLEGGACRWDNASRSRNRSGASDERRRVAVASQSAHPRRRVLTF